MYGIVRSGTDARTGCRYNATVAPAFQQYLAQYAPQYSPQDIFFDCTPRNLEYVLEDLGKLATIHYVQIGFETLRWTCHPAISDGMPEEQLRQNIGVEQDYLARDQAPKNLRTDGQVTCDSEPNGRENVRSSRAAGVGSGVGIALALARTRLQRRHRLCAPIGRMPKRQRQRPNWSGVRAAVIEANAGRDEEMQALVAESAHALGSVDIFVGNAAGGAARPMSEIDRKACGLDARRRHAQHTGRGAVSSAVDAGGPRLGANPHGHQHRQPARLFQRMGWWASAKLRSKP
jgi:hypothetical protein